MVLRFNRIVSVSEMKIGSKGVEYEGSRFEILSSENGKTTLRCIDPDPVGVFKSLDKAPPYGLNTVIVLDDNTEINYEPQW